MRVIRKVWLFVALALGVVPVGAQQLPFGNYTIEDGLVDSVVFTMYQDSEGYLWFGTRAGLNRFDGLEFETFTTAEGLAHNVIRSITESRDGTLWVGTERGLSRRVNGFFLSSTTADGLPHHSVRCLVEDDEGAMWAGTYGGGLCRIRDGTVDTFTTADGLPHDKIRTGLRSSSGELWFGTMGGGVFRVEDGGFTSFGANAGLENLEVRTLWEDPDGRIWVGTGDGVFRGDGDRFRKVYGQGALGSEVVNVVTADNRGRIWLGTREGGAYSLTPGGIRRYRTDQGLADNSIVSILEDSENNLWFGTYGGGLSRLSTESIRNYSSQEGFEYANVYSIAEDHSGALWFGTNGGGVSRLGEDGTFTVLSTAEGLAHNKVVSVMVDRDGRIWFGTLEGVSMLSGGHLTTFRASSGLASDIVYDIAQDRNGAVWFATYDGLSRLQSGRWQSFTMDDGLADDRVNVILEASDGALWFGTANGLSRYDDGRFTSFTTADGLVSEFVNHLFEDAAGVLWICTNGGLSRFDGTSFVSFTTADGLSHNSCTVVLQAEDGALWIGTNRGVNRFDGTTFSVVTSKDGLVADLINRGAGYKDRAGNLWFGTIAGVTMIESDFATFVPDPPKVHLREVLVEDQPVPVDAELRLPHDRNFLKFEFVGLSFRRANDVEYRYRLRGLEEAWQQSRVRQVQYTSLPSGDYVFEVTARCGASGWGREPTTFAFTIVPPFWRTMWFMGALLVLAVGLVAWRVVELKRQTEQLENRVRERTAEVERINDELRWLALNDPLTGLRNRRYVYEIMPEEMSRLRRAHRRQGDGEEDDRGGATLGIAVVDLDFFKRVNDTWDHSVGDAVLRGVAELFRRCSRDSDVVARWGGEEFLFILRDVRDNGLREMAQRLLDILRSTPIRVDEDISVDITCSVGYTHFPTHLPAAAYSWEDVLKVADTALYEAKQAGRDCAVGLDYDRSVEPERMMALLTRDVQAAIAVGYLKRIRPDRADES